MRKDANEQIEIYKSMQKKHNSKIRQMALKFKTFLKNHFPRTIWPRKKDDLKGHKF